MTMYYFAYASNMNRRQMAARCPASLEAEAYAVQSGFLRAAGLGREAVMMRLLADHLGLCAD